MNLNDCTVQLVNCSASDAMVIAAARVSTQGEDSLAALSGDAAEGRGLINFLMKNCHGTPFEHNMFTFFIESPIFVFREFHRHRIGWSYNETSGRYKELANRFYIPPENRPLIQVGKPGAYDFVPGDEFMQLLVNKTLMTAYEQAWEHYQTLLTEGVAKEVSRLVLPVGIMSSMYATCNARSLMSFLKLRTDDPQAKVPSKPQWEIDKLVARKMEALFAEQMPITHATWVENGRIAP
jgi:thymidylate synthase (FAD)